MGSFNNLIAAAVIALTMPAVAAATPLTGEAPQIGALTGESGDALLFDGAGGGAFALFTGESTTSLRPATLRPVTDPLSLTLTTSSTGTITGTTTGTTSGTTALTQVPLPGALLLLLGGVAAFGAVAARRKPA